MVFPLIKFKKKITFSHINFTTMKKLYAVSLLLILIGCYDPMDKPLYEALTVEEIKEEMGKNPDFEAMYIILEKIQNSEINTNAFKAKWSEITYNRLLDYRDLVTFLQLEENQLKFKDNWNFKYKIGIRKTDSIISYWEKHVPKESIAKGKRYHNDDMPAVVRDYYNGFTSRTELRANMIRSYYDTFESLNIYKMNEIDEYLKEEDPLMHSFLESTKHLR